MSYCSFPELQKIVKHKFILQESLSLENLYIDAYNPRDGKNEIHKNILCLVLWL